MIADHSTGAMEHPESSAEELADGFQELHFDSDASEDADLFMDAFKGMPEAEEPGSQRNNPFLRIAYGRKLLDYEQERELGRRLSDGRRDMTDALSALIPCIEHLCVQWDRAVVNERSPGEVLQWPSGSAGSGDQRGGTSPARRHMATLSLQLSLWLRENADSDALEAPLHLRAAFVESAPAFSMLCELKQVARDAGARIEAGSPARRCLERALQESTAAEMRFQEARRVMVESNLRLVFSIAGKFVNNGIGYDDLVQEGAIGLLRAIEKFDPGLGFKFSTYASTWIWQATTRAIANQRRTVRVPAHIHDKMIRIRSLAAAFHQRTGREPDVAELMQESGFSEDVVTRALNAANRSLSLDAPLRAGEDTTFLDLTADEEQSVAQDQVQLAELSDIVGRELASLPRREATIVSLRLGLGGTQALTLEEIGAILGITRERTRQLQNRAFATLRERLKDDRNALI
jgi:RNA polymerase primary sigma factor